MSRALLIGTVAGAVATLALSFLGPSPAHACGCSRLGTDLVFPQEGSIAANGVFVLRDLGWFTGPALTNARGENVPLVEVAAHSDAACTRVVLMRPAQPLVAGDAYTLLLDGWGSIPVTPRAAETPATELPQFTSSAIAWPERYIDRAGCRTWTVTEWHRVDVAAGVPGELTIFSGFRDPTAGNLHSARVARVVDGQPPVATPCDGNCPPCPLCVARLGGNGGESCVEVRAYSVDGTEVGRSSLCAPTPPKGSAAGSGDSGTLHEPHVAGEAFDGHRRTTRVRC